ncbi:hypothetical protein J2Z42_002451 [Clostridium algifaecis]|uniref:DUF3794 domain-containing protein n=1 Tax=Clostridium algifaecis TaxID=1472040 RepID=A0ABS4KXY5_9CLOT|nr:hypothetical protein [Clostridium algifaecis]MBP2033744.1 hypothetical protein [Clostridium algifaecis]
MRISAAKFKFTEKDILNIIKDYVQLDEINIEEVLIGEIVIIKGKYVKKLNVPFEIQIGIGSIKNNYLNIKIYKLKVMGLKIAGLIKDAITKNIINDLFSYGMRLNNDTILINLSDIVKLIPHFNFNLTKINIVDGTLELEAENIVKEE